MNLLFDANISNRVLGLLSDSFHNCKHVKEAIRQDAKDIEIFEFAKTKNYTIVTYDQDFYNLVLQKGAPPKIILLRTGTLKTKFLVSVLEKNLETISQFLKNDDPDIDCLIIQ